MEYHEGTASPGSACTPARGPERSKPSADGFEPHECAADGCRALLASKVGKVKILKVAKEKVERKATLRATTARANASRMFRMLSSKGKGSITQVVKERVAKEKVERGDSKAGAIRASCAGYAARQAILSCVGTFPIASK